MHKVLFICTGNICRSPTAEGVLRHRLAEKNLAEIVHVDSAGTHSYHVGEAPDPRSIASAAKRGIDLSDLRARKLIVQDFYDFDLMLACDQSHLDHMKNMAPPDATATLALYLPHVKSTQGKEIPDPYYGSHRDFEAVLDMIEDGTRRLIAMLTEKQS